MKTIHNERVKLSATFLYGTAIAIFAVGVFAPTVQAMREAAPEPWHTTGLIVLVCLGLSAALHFGARWMLGGLIE
jgi:uncharacterized membrane protein YoaK (UPF0700 family)